MLSTVFATVAVANAAGQSDRGQGNVEASIAHCFSLTYNNKRYCSAHARLWPTPAECARFKRSVAHFIHVIFVQYIDLYAIPFCNVSCLCDRPTFVRLCSGKIVIALVKKANSIRTVCLEIMTNSGIIFVIHTGKRPGNCAAMTNAEKSTHTHTHARLRCDWKCGGGGCVRGTGKSHFLEREKWRFSRMPCG